MEKKIKDWVTEKTLNKENWKILDDFHVEGGKDNWLKNGLQIYKEVNDYLTLNKLPFYAELSIKLKYTKEETGINFSNIFHIEKQLSTTPPSIYIFPNNYKDLNTIMSKSLLVNKSILGEENTFYREVYDKSENEFFRVIFIVPLLRDMQSSEL